MLSLETHTWSKLPDMTTVRRGFGAAVVGKTVVVAGGFNGITGAQDLASAEMSRLVQRTDHRPESQKEGTWVSHEDGAIFLRSNSSRSAQARRHRRGRN